MFRTGFLLTCAGILCSTTLLTPAAQAAPLDEIPRALSMTAVVDPGTSTTNWTAVSGIEQLAVPIEDLIGPKGKYVYRIRTIHALLQLDSAPGPAQYARVAVAACGVNGGTSGFGAGTLVVAGGEHEQVTYDPGLVASLPQRFELCAISSIQSNQRVFFQVHGYLQDREEH